MSNAVANDKENVSNGSNPITEPNKRIKLENAKSSQAPRVVCLHKEDFDLQTIKLCDGVFQYNDGTPLVVQTPFLFTNGLQVWENADRPTQYKMNGKFPNEEGKGTQKFKALLDHLVGLTTTQFGFDGTQTFFGPIDANRHNDVKFDMNTKQGKIVSTGQIVEVDQINDPNKSLDDLETNSFRPVKNLSGEDFKFGPGHIQLMVKFNPWKMRGDNDNKMRGGLKAVVYAYRHIIDEDAEFQKRAKTEYCIGKKPTLSVKPEEVTFDQIPQGVGSKGMKILQMVQGGKAISFEAENESYGIEKDNMSEQEKFNFTLRLSSGDPLIEELEKLDQKLLDKVQSLGNGFNGLNQNKTVKESNGNFYFKVKVPFNNDKFQCKGFKRNAAGDISEIVDLRTVVNQNMKSKYKVIITIPQAWLVGKGFGLQCQLLQFEIQEEEEPDFTGGFK